MHLRIILIATLVSAISVSTAFPQEAARAARAVAVETPPIIDGVIDEEVWQLADPITGFTQTWPVEGDAATEETVVRVLYTDTAVYVGAVLYDTDPSSLSDFRRKSFVFNNGPF